MQPSWTTSSVLAVLVGIAAVPMMTLIWRELTAAYNVKLLTENTYPQFYVGTNTNFTEEELLEQFASMHHLKQHKWVKYNTWNVKSYAEMSLFSDATRTKYYQALDAYFGNFTNRALENMLSSMDINDRPMMESLFWNGRAMKETVSEHSFKPYINSRLNITHALCSASYNGYQNADNTTKVLFGRCASTISSNMHGNAVIIGYKAVAPEDMGASWTDESKPFDMEVTLFFRGSNFWPGSDWWINIGMVRLVDTDGVCKLPLLKTHAGYLHRHKRIWPLIVEDIRRVEDFLLGEKGTINRIRFAVGGHSQGGALATLAALSLSRTFPDSSVFLFTFSAPAIFESDPLPETQIRHMRFAVDNDFVPMEWFGRKHAGTRHITIDGKAAGLGALEAHSLDKYMKVVNAMAAGDYSTIK